MAGKKDAHGHSLGSHAAHGPEANFDPTLSSQKESSSDIEAPKHEDHGFEDSMSTQIIGVAILEFGVVLHR